MKRPAMVWLIVLIPAMSVVMGGVMLWAATQGGSQEIRVEEQPLSKTSWREKDE